MSEHKKHKSGRFCIWTKYFLYSVRETEQDGAPLMDVHELSWETNGEFTTNKLLQPIREKVNRGPWWWAVQMFHKERIPKEACTGRGWGPRWDGRCQQEVDDKLKSLQFLAKLQNATKVVGGLSEGVVTWPSQWLASLKVKYFNECKGFGNSRKWTAGYF